ncbi:hypothetical protein [Mastigocladopsis repens]|uniref:hypothetical protein n=1 Tax=Mastigocladopsis repens TaxID=221287 RepID=UPI0002E7E0C5|nr:hypothetical protein [Mastigocladopsis repens]
MAQNQSLEELLKKIREQEQRLDSTEIQLAFEKEPDQAKRRAFIKDRGSYRNARIQLENKILEKTAKNLKPLESQLEEGIKDLEISLRKLDNTVAILSKIENVTNILGSIVTIL